jgi:hypothetical protein
VRARSTNSLVGSATHFPPEHGPSRRGYQADALVGRWVSIRKRKWIIIVAAAVLTVLSTASVASASWRINTNVEAATGQPGGVQ